MDRFERIFSLLGIVYVLANFAIVRVEGYCALPGFTAISNLAEIGSVRDLYIYAINKIDDLENDVEFTKDSGLPSDVVKTGTIETTVNSYGCFLKVKEPYRQKGLRYGRYVATRINGPPGPPSVAETFVKPQSKLLDTRGVYTVTIYPEVFGVTPIPDPVSIGVSWSPGCRKIVWCKGKKQRINTGPRLILTSTEDAGLYTIQRPGRGKRGWFVQIRVIAASCPERNFLGSDGSCQQGFNCVNGGVLKDKENVCICPTFFSFVNCHYVVDPLNGDRFVLASTLLTDGVLCRDLPGGDPKCKGYLVCSGDNYGCKCSSGWSGNACDKPCPKGKYGANCEQTCPESESACSRFFGPSSGFIIPPNCGGQ